VASENKRARRRAWRQRGSRASLRKAILWHSVREMARWGLSGSGSTDKILRAMREGDKLPAARGYITNGRWIKWQRAQRRNGQNDDFVHERQQRFEAARARENTPRSLRAMFLDTHIDVFNLLTLREKLPG
jgi:hypothetical protein